MGRRLGRKTILTPEMIQQAEKLLKAGNYVKVVAEYLGIDASTWYDWIIKGEEGRSELYTNFANTVKKAQTTAEIGAVAGILTAANDGNWQAYAWFLERKFNDRWARRDHVRQEITGKDGEALKFPEIVVNFTNQEKATDEETS